MMPPRVVLVGGPYDGHVWLPLLDSMTTVWAGETPIPNLPGLDHTAPSASPTSFSADPEFEYITFDGPLGPAEYEWLDDDCWYAQPYADWLTTPEDDEPEFEEDWAS